MTRRYPPGKNQPPRLHWPRPGDGERRPYCGHHARDLRYARTPGGVTCGMCQRGAARAKEGR